jgi:hypothetical protein
MGYVHIVKKGSFVSVPDLSHRQPLPTAHEPHILFMPKSVDNSSGGQVWVTSPKWGPLQGRLLHMSYGQSSLYEVLTQEVDGVVQGGVARIPLKFATGLMRARFAPHDGELYVAGQRGWQTNGTEDGAIQRVRYTGKPHFSPKALRVTDRVERQHHRAGELARLVEDRIDGFGIDLGMGRPACEVTADVEDLVQDEAQIPQWRSVSRHGIDFAQGPL